MEQFTGLHGGNWCVGLQPGGAGPVRARTVSDRSEVYVGPKGSVRLVWCAFGFGRCVGVYCLCGRKITDHSNRLLQRHGSSMALPSLRSGPPMRGRHITWVPWTFCIMQHECLSRKSIIIHRLLFTPTFGNSDWVTHTAGDSRTTMAPRSGTYKKLSLTSMLAPFFVRSPFISNPGSF